MILGKSRKVAAKKNKIEKSVETNYKGAMNDMYTNILIKKFNHKAEDNEVKHAVGHTKAITDALPSHRSNESSNSPTRYRKYANNTANLRVSVGINGGVVK